jgi:hypothetical protein
MSDLNRHHAPPDAWHCACGYLVDDRQYQSKLVDMPCPKCHRRWSTFRQKGKVEGMIDWKSVWDKYWEEDSEASSMKSAQYEVERQLKGHERGSLGVATCFACEECAANVYGEPFGCGNDGADLIKDGVIKLDPDSLEIVCADFLTHEEQAEPPDQDDIDD